MTLHHRPDALQAADDAIAFKRAAKGVARTLGCEATFMAKPFGDIAGSGMHIHMSVIDKDDANIFSAEEPKGYTCAAPRHRRNGRDHGRGDGGARA